MIKSCAKVFVFIALGKWRSKTLASNLKINGVNPLYIINHKINGYIEENNRNTYLTLVPTDECKRLTEKNMKKCGVKSYI